jgi:TRAP-type C4-dicarboxylate transport system permease small subunit
MSNDIEIRGKSTVENWPWLKGLLRVCEVIGSVALTLMVFIIVVDIVTRNLFGFSLQISDEVCGYLLVCTTFIAMPFSLANGGWHKVHFVEDRLNERTRLGLQIGIGILSLFVCVLIEWYLARFVVLDYRSGGNAMTDLNTPLWIPQAVMPIGFGLLCVVLAAVIVTTIGKFRALSHISRDADGA